MTSFNNGLKVSVIKGASAEAITSATISCLSSKSTAIDKATEASASASTASAQASIATAQASIATTKANEASVSASASSLKANEASSSASSALTSKMDAATSEENALSYKNSASVSAATATNKASEASDSVDVALAYQYGAESAYNSTLSLVNNLVLPSVTHTVDTVDDFGTIPNGIYTVIVKDINRGGTFIYDATQSAVNNGGTIFDGWVRQYSGAVNVKWFGARGDGLGTTPADDGVDISSAPWNTWDNTPFKDDLAYSPYASGGVFTPDRVVPFANDDTWDYIGISLALWQGKTTFIPAGTYKINLASTTDKGTYNGLLLMNGLEQTVYGEGKHDTVITTAEDAAFFADNNVGTTNFYKLLELYRTGGQPTILDNILFKGPTSYASTNENLTLIHQQNINGVVLNNLWLSTADYGVHATLTSGDSTISLCTSEYLFSATLYTDSTSEYRVDFCNFWASTTTSTQKGIVADGYISVTNTKLNGFYGGACKGASGTFSNNTVGIAGSGYISFTDNVVFNNNRISGSTNKYSVSIAKDATIIGNYFYQTGQHACLNIGDGSASANTATNISIIGNTFIKTDATAVSQNYAIIAEQQGSSYTAAATHSCIIEGNTFQGRALSVISDATIRTNTFDGVLQSKVITEAVTISGDTTFTGVKNVENDVLGKEVMNASAGTSGSYTITITGALGIGSGTTRSQQRLNLIHVLSNASGHIVRGWALYTSRYDGNAVLISTLGSNNIGGTITFGVSGANPKADITNTTSNIPTYTVNAIPLI